MSQFQDSFVISSQDVQVAILQEMMSLEKYYFAVLNKIRLFRKYLFVLS